jgi:hypothetical protein
MIDNGECVSVAVAGAPGARPEAGGAITANRVVSAIMSVFGGATDGSADVDSAAGMTATGIPTDKS